MLFYRMEEWDDIDDVAIRWMRENGLLPVLTYIAEEMRDAWWLMDRAVEESDETARDMAHLRSHSAYGAYNALLSVAHSEHNDEVWDAIYNWGHYSVFY